MFEPNKNREEQISQMTWHQQRKEYRRIHREDLHRREGLGADGVGIGIIKGVGSGVSMEEGYAAAARYGEGGFALLDAPGLSQELEDLGRDAARVEAAELVVHHGVDGGHEMDSTIVDSEKGLLAWTAAIVAEGDAK